MIQKKRKQSITLVEKKEKKKRRTPIALSGKGTDLLLPKHQGSGKRGEKGGVTASRVFVDVLPRSSKKKKEANFCILHARENSVEKGKRES